MAEDAWRAGQLDLLVWVTADNRDAVVAAYARAVAEIDGTHAAAGSAGAGAAMAEQAAQAFLARLRPEADGSGHEVNRPATSGNRQDDSDSVLGTPHRWLIVLDDVADPEDLQGLWPPENPGGRVLVTARRRDVAQPGLNRAVIQVAGFTPDEATTYLSEVLTAYGREPGPTGELDALARELGCLPLALAQTAAQLAGTGQDCGTYAGLLREYDLLAGPDERSGVRRGRPLAGLLPGPGALPDGQGVVVTEAWQSLLDRADRLPPAELARPLLEVASLLPVEGAPESVFTNRACTEYVQQRRATPSPGQLSCAPRTSRRRSASWTAWG